MKPTQGMMVVVAGLGLLSVGQLASAEDGTRGKSDRLADAKLELEVETQLTRDERLPPQVVIVEVDKGVVTLTGTVATAADKVYAEQIARSAGADRIDNRVTVADDAGKNTDPEQRPAARLESPKGEKAAQSDPRRRAPLVGAPPAEQTGSKGVHK